MNYQKTILLASLDTSACAYLGDYASLMLGYSLKTYLILIPFVMFFFVGLAGMFSLVKRICFCQASNFYYYFEGIKKNWFHFVMWGLIVGVSLFFLCFNINYYNASQMNQIFKGVLIGFSILQFVLICVATMYFLTGDVTYNYKFFQSVKNAFLFAFNGLFVNLGVAVLGLIPFFVTLLIPSPFQLLALAVLGLFYLGVLPMFWNCFAQSVYDKCINFQLGTEFGGRGLRKD
ncbi:MAG: hypothetical protein RRY18_01435 [Clostridia bacterium]